MLLVKKYPNRRLYDTRHSRYITLDDLEKTIRGGEDVVVQDAQDGRDLTQETLTQIILDRNNGRILPAALLLRLIRLDDAALGEFLTRYVSWALDMYVQAKDRARALLPLNPLATAPFAATDALARLVLGAAQWGRGGDASAQAVPPAVAPTFHPEDGGAMGIEPPPVDVSHLSHVSLDPAAVPPPPESRSSVTALAPELSDEMQRLRHEIEALKASLAPGSRSRPASRAKSKAKPKRATKRA